MTPDLAFSIGLLAGYLALIVEFVWKIPHCACCSKAIAKSSNRRHK